jgi:hypothetical protein
MSQININTPPSDVEPVETRSDRTTAAGLNLVTVLIVLAVLAVIVWFLVTGPLHAFNTGSAGSTNVNVNPPPTTVNVNPPGQNTGSGSNTTSSTTSSSTTTRTVTGGGSTTGNTSGGSPSSTNP